MIPDKIEEEETQIAKKFGVFGATLITFFFAEMGDKTQIATVAMAAHYAAPLLVVIGTTLGMLIADVPAVFVGDKLAAKIPMKLVHSIAAGIFVLLVVATLLGMGAKLGSNPVSVRRRTMHADNLSTCIHDHVFDESSLSAERSTRTVMWITAAYNSTPRSIHCLNAALGKLTRRCTHTHTAFADI